MSGGADPLLRHIRHAEDWLGRARLDWRRGNAPAAMLRLMLAEAEIRHARESGAAAPPGGRRVAWPKAAAAIAAAAVVAAGLGYASIRSGQQGGLAERAGSPAALPSGLSRTIVRLDTGQFLMPDREQIAGSGPVPSSPGAGDVRPLQFAMPADLKSPSPTF